MSFYCIFILFLKKCFIGFIFHTQYFETDDQEFYKTKVCFILNNDVSEMDLVFAEEKYSKSGQLEKVRQHFWKRTSSFIPDVISQEIGAINQAKGTILLVWPESCFSLKRGSGVFTLNFKALQTLFLLLSYKIPHYLSV